MNLLSKTRSKYEPDESVVEQVRKVIELAEQFDKLQAMPGWETVLRHMAADINAALAQASINTYEPEKQRIAVVRWGAKRELLDDVQSFIESQQAERDRIVAEHKEIRDGRGDTEGN